MVKWYRACDMNGFDCWDWLLAFFGWFHIKMCLANAIFANHRGTERSHGFARDINLLGIKGLSANKKKPMFHTINDLLRLEHAARIRLAWLWATESDSIASLHDTLNADENPSRLRHLAEKIVLECMSSAALTSFAQETKRDFVLEGSITLLPPILRPFADLFREISRNAQGKFTWIYSSPSHHFEAE